MEKETQEKRAGLFVDFDDEGLLRLFKVISKSKNESMKEIINRFVKSYVDENIPNLAEELKK